MVIFKAELFKWWFSKRNCSNGDFQNGIV